MVSPGLDQALNKLRMVTYRLSITPPPNLTLVVPVLADAIATSREAFVESQNDKHKTEAPEIDVVIHKLKTKLFVMLQEKTLQSRYSAVILMKAVVEVGGWNVLHGVGAWVRALITLMGKPDPLATKKLCIITLTRIFHLTHEHQSLVREITMPSLSPFIAACLGAIETRCPPKYPDVSRGPGDSSPLQAFPNPRSHTKLLGESRGQDVPLVHVLEAFGELIALHPTSFRPYVQRMQTLVLPLIAPTPSNMDHEQQPTAVPRFVSEAAQRLYVLLHVCAPKNTAGEEWTKTLQFVIVSAQTTADQVFRGFVEDWRPGSERISHSSSSMGELVADQTPQPLTVPAWTGIHAGVERLDGLLRIVHAFLLHKTSTAVKLPTGSIISLVDRIVSALQVSGIKNSRTRPEISREEREGLEYGLPRLHVAAMVILSALMWRMGSGSAPLTNFALERISRVVDCEQRDGRVKRTGYRVISQVIKAFGLALPTTCSVPISRCINLCLGDLLPSDGDSANTSENSPANSMKHLGKKPSAMNADSYLKSDGMEPLKTSTVSTGLIAEAETLLSFALAKLPTKFISLATRSRIERVAILTNNKRVMTASVMNSPANPKGTKSTPSILPMLARAQTDISDFEALIRPQMPMIRFQEANVEERTSDDEEDLQPYVRDSAVSQDAFHDRFGRQDDDTLGNSVAKAKDDEKEATFMAGSHEIASSEATSAEVLSIEQQPVSQLEPQRSPGKRTREAGSSLEVEDRASLDADVEEGSMTKKPRLEPKEAEQGQLLGTSSDDIQVPSAVSPQAKSSQASFSKIFESAEGDLDAEATDSDGSDFEMPTLHLDTDSEEDSKDEQ